MAGDKAGGGFEEGVDDAKFVGAEGGAGLGEFDDGVDEFVGFEFGGAPGEFDFGFYAVFFEVAFGELDDFGGDAFAFEVFDGFDGGVFLDAKDPAGGLAGGFAEKEFADFVDVGGVFADPIEASDAAVEEAVFDVAADFLGANEADFHFVVVDVWDVGAAADLDVESGLGHFFDGRVLEASFGEAEAQLVLVCHSFGARSGPGSARTGNYQ